MRGVANQSHGPHEPGGAITRRLPGTRRRLWALQRRVRVRACDEFWRFGPSGRTARTALSALKNTQIGRTCFVIGNGPSLRLDDLRSLRNELTIASNGIFLAFEDTGFEPTFYTVEDKLVAQDRAEEIGKIRQSIKIFPADLRVFLGPSDDSIFILFRREYANFPKWSMNLSRGAYFGGTVTYLNLQLAFHLGCDKVYLLGVDHSYKVPPSLTEDVIVSDSADVNHFDPNYFGPGYRYHDPKLPRMEAAYHEASRFASRNGKQILNATRGGKLDVFERASLDEVLKTVGNNS